MAQAVVNPFTIQPVNRLRAEGASRWARLLPVGGNVLIRGMMARYVDGQLQAEGALRDAELRQGFAALNVVSDAIPFRPEVYFGQAEADEVCLAVGARMPVNDWVNPIDIPVADLWVGAGGLGAQLLDVVPDANQNVRFDPVFFAAAILGMAAGHAANQNAQNYPAAANAILARPGPEYLHPYMFGGCIAVNFQTGAALVLADGDRPANVAISSVGALITLMQPSRGRHRMQIAQLVVAAVTSISCGGNVSGRRLGQINRQVAIETGMDAVEVTRDVIHHCWAYAQRFWDQNNQNVAFVNGFQDMFNFLGQAVRDFSQKLALLCQQTSLYGLTAVACINRAIRAYPDFPWDALAQQIGHQTGQDEAANAAVAVADVAGNNGQFLGWRAALAPGAFQGRQRLEIARFPNLAYACVQLLVQAGGQQSLRDYRGVAERTLTAKAMIDDWVTQYVQARAQVNYPGNNGAGQNPHLVAIAAANI